MASLEPGMTPEASLRSSRAVKYSPNLTVDELVTRGAAGGLTAGMVFIVANMYFAQSSGKPPIAPFLAISTLFRKSEMP